MTVSVLQLNAENSNLGTSSTTIADTTTYTAGSYLHVLVGSTHGVTVSSVASNRGETFVSKGQVVDTTDTKQATHFVSTTPAVGGSTVITATYSGSIDRRFIVIAEIGGAAGGYDSTADANAEQLQATPTTGTDATTSTNTPTLTSQPALIVGICWNGSADATPAAGTGFTSAGTRVTYGGAVSAVVRVESKRVTATTALAATFTAGANKPHGTFAAVFLENAAASFKSAWARNSNVLLSGELE